MTVLAGRNRATKREVTIAKRFLPGVQEIIDLFHSSKRYAGLGDWLRHLDASEVFGTILVFPVEIPDSVADRVSRSVGASMGDIQTPEDLLKIANRLLEEWSQTEVVEYALYGTFYGGSVERLSFRPLGRTLTVNPRMTMKTSDEIKRGLTRAEGLHPHIPSKDRTVFRITCRGRSETEAVDDGARAFNYQRALWNYVAHRRTAIKQSRYFEPENSVVAGPSYTLHDKAGRPCAMNPDAFWYEAEWYAPKGRASLKSILKGPQVFLDSYFSHLRRSSYRSWLEDCMWRFGAALDVPSKRQAILRLWSLLEHLTGFHGELVKHDSVVSRSAFVMRDDGLSRWVLEHLRERRNVVAHRHEDSFDPQHSLTQLIQQVQLVFEFHLVMSTTVNHPNSTVELMNNPRDPKNLRDKIRNLEAALRYREKPSL